MRLTIKTKLAAAFGAVIAMSAGSMVPAKSAGGEDGFDLDLGDSHDDLDGELARRGAA